MGALPVLDVAERTGWGRHLYRHLHRLGLPLLVAFARAWVELEVLGIRRVDVIVILALGFAIAIARLGSPIVNCPVGVGELVVDDQLASDRERRGDREIRDARLNRFARLSERRRKLAASHATVLNIEPTSCQKPRGDGLQTPVLESWAQVCWCCMSHFLSAGSVSLYASALSHTFFLVSRHGSPLSHRS